MIKINQTNTSSKYRSDAGTVLFLGTRPEGDKSVSTFMVTVNQGDDLATSAQEGGEFAIALKVYHTDGMVVSQASTDEALHYINTYAIPRITTLLAGPIEFNDMVDRVVV